MKNLFTFFCLLTFLSFEGFSQCNTGSNQGLITPTTVAQNTAVVSANRPYWTFTADAGCEYIFETCGLSTMDTYLRIYDASWTQIASNDDACGNRSRIQILFNTSGTYHVFLTRYSFFGGSCQNINANVQVSYRKNCTFTDNECWGATQVCSNTAFSSNTSNFGSYQELNASNQGCLVVENQSYWYYFIAAANGTIAFNITTCDYDFALWQTGNCGNLGAPVRCSYASPDGNTGLNASAVDVSEGAFGDKFVAPLNVIAGQQYILLVDNYTSNNQAFTLNWNLSAPGLLDCTPTPLPLEIVNFKGYKSTSSNILKWNTESENTIERMEIYFTSDPINESSWELIQDYASNASSIGKSYQFNHTEFRIGNLNYYKLIQVDKNGNRTLYPGIQVIDNTINGKKISKVLNILGQETTMDTKGTLILVYEDGTLERIFN